MWFQSTQARVSYFILRMVFNMSTAGSDITEQLGRPAPSVVKSCIASDVSSHFQPLLPGEELRRGTTSPEVQLQLIHATVLRIRYFPQYNNVISCAHYLLSRIECEVVSSQSKHRRCALTASDDCKKFAYKCVTLKKKYNCFYLIKKRWFSD